ncbi:hypothetical protein BpHYR1_001242 [Brachionus plicatilis]|uniref:Uncharacterized protein n=1 Tax=Brachionus plicatilis TaxID=10195 RepID=A0A3M7S5A8_BRAPC|nr:hypothetical protein BpHYR1_001242 [Brachionus plicatilis]
MKFPMGIRAYICLLNSSRLPLSSQQSRLCKNSAIFCLMHTTKKHLINICNKLHFLHNKYKVLFSDLEQLAWTGLFGTRESSCPIEEIHMCP